MALDDRSVVGSTIDRAVSLEKSPVAEGFVAGLKAALLGGPIGAGYQAMHGKDPLTGAIVGAVVPGIIAALLKGSSRKLRNLETEAELRYHAENIKNREPLFFMPPRQTLGRFFSRRYDGE